MVPLFQKRFSRGGQCPDLNYPLVIAKKELTKPTKISVGSIISSLFLVERRITTFMQNLQLNSNKL